MFGMGLNKMSIRQLIRLIVFIAAMLFMGGPWAFAYDGASHGFFLNRSNYGLIETILWNLVLSYIYYSNYRDLSRSNQMSKFIFESSYTVSCLSFLLMMDWHHKPLIVPVYLIFCLICGTLTYALNRYQASLSAN